MGRKKRDNVETNAPGCSCCWCRGTKRVYIQSETLLCLFSPVNFSDKESLLQTAPLPSRTAEKFTLHIILFLAQLQCFTLLLFSTWVHKQSSWRLSASLKSTLIVASNIVVFSGHNFPCSSHGKMVTSQGLNDCGVDKTVKKFIKTTSFSLKNQINAWRIELTILDSAADNSLLFLAISPGLCGRSLDVGTPSPHPQLEGEVVAG